jgi:hypothetical protein
MFSLHVAAATSEINNRWHILLLVRLVLAIQSRQAKYNSRNR